MYRKDKKGAIKREGRGSHEEGRESESCGGKGKRAMRREGKVSHEEEGKLIAMI